MTGNARVLIGCMLIACCLHSPVWSGQGDPQDQYDEDAVDVGQGHPAGSASQSLFGRLFGAGKAEKSGSSVASLGATEKVAADSRTAGQERSLLDAASESYWERDFGKASALVDRVLQMNADNDIAVQMRARINRMQASEASIISELADENYYKALYFFEKGNILDAMLQVNRTLLIDPQSEQARSLDASIKEIMQNIVSSIQNKGDQRLFLRAVKLFLQEKFLTAQRAFRSLSEHYPDYAEYIGVSSSHLSEQTNTIRASYFMDEAQADIFRKRLDSARENVIWALEMDPGVISARVMLAQLNLELGVESSSL